MNKNITFLLVVVVLNLIFWTGINILQEKTEALLYERELSQNPPVDNSLFLAQILENQPPKYPDYYSEFENYEVKAKSALSLKLKPNGEQEIIFQKNIQQKLPLASLSKLMAGIVASEFYQGAEQIKVSRQALSQLEKTGFLKLDEMLSVNELLHMMLIESSNDAAYAIGELMGADGFVGLMNLKARDIGMDNTFFYSTNGLDPDDLQRPDSEINYSTARDLIKLSIYLLKEKPEILEISKKEKYDLYLNNGVFHHTLYNTNELLVELDNIVGSKTGLTDRAGGCLLLILKDTDGSHIINILLNSPDRFNDMRKLITLQ